MSKGRRACWAFALLALLSSSMPAVVHAAGGRKLYDKGVVVFEGGDYETAATLFAEAYAAEPDPAYLFSEASAYRRLGKAELAAERYEKYLEVVPAGERADKRAKAAGYAANMRHALGLEYQARGDCRMAMAHFRKAVGHKPGHGAAWVALGECAEALGERALAESAYDRALAVLPLDDALRVEAHERLEALRVYVPETGPAVGAHATTAPTPGSETAKKKRSPVVGVVFGVVGGLVLAGTVVTVVLVAGRSGAAPLEFPGGVGVMSWETGR